MYSAQAKAVVCLTTHTYDMAQNHLQPSSRLEFNGAMNSFRRTLLFLRRLQPRPPPSHVHFNTPKTGNDDCTARQTSDTSLISFGEKEDRMIERETTDDSSFRQASSFVQSVVSIPDKRSVSVSFESKQESSQYSSTRSRQQSSVVVRPNFL